MPSPLSLSLSLSSSPFKPDCLQGRTALVTGGGSGIGYEIARQLLLHGCGTVLICGRRQQFLDDAVANLRRELRMRSRGQGQHQQEQQVVHGFACDVRKPAQCQAAVECLANLVKTTATTESTCEDRRSNSTPSLDILVNGAAGNFLAPAEDLTPKGFETVLAIDAMGTFNMTSAAFSLLKNSTCPGGASVINISATLQYGASHWQIHASAAKSAVDSMTRSWALEWGSAYKIRVNGIAPGPIADTPGTTKLAPTTSSTGRANDRTSQVEDWVRDRIPLQRMGTAEEIGHAVVYLCTAQFVTGAILVVDGGEWLYKPPLISRQQVGMLSRKVEAASRAQKPARSAAGLLPPRPPPPLQSML